MNANQNKTEIYFFMDVQNMREKENKNNDNMKNQ